MDFDLQNDTLSPVPRRLEHPYDNVPVLDWWKYDYDHVFHVAGNENYNKINNFHFCV